jgi:hypothetical protein
MMARAGRLLTALVMVAMAAILGLVSAALVNGCAGWQPQFRAVDPEHIIDPKYGECARTGVTLQASSTQFAMLTSLCMQRVGDAGVVIDPPEPEPAPKDAGVVQLPGDEVDQ